MNRQIILISVATFAAGLLSGALVFSQVSPFATDASSLSAPADGESAEAQSETTIPTTTIPNIGAVRVVEDGAASPEPDVSASDQASAPNYEPESKQAVEILLARIDDISAGWGRMQADLAELRQRIAQLEQHDSEQGAENDAASKRPERPKTPEAQRDALLRAGVAAEVAEDIVWRRAQVSLDRLDLRDQAIREGWLNTDRYREELSKINQERVSVRDEIGVDSFDRYLFETGQNNRVLVDSIIPGSAGEESGMLPGDVIENYGEQKVFNFRDLRGATSDGERGELVPVVVRRGGQRLELWLPRGPIGIGLDATRVDPQG